MSEQDVLRERTDQLRKDFDSHETKQDGEMVRIWKAIDDLKNRLPVWATLLIAALGTIGGYLAKH